MEQISHSLQVKSKDGDKETVGSYHLEYYTKQEAIRKGIKMFVVTLVVALLTIVLPGIHFVSVPLGVLASPFVGAYIYSTRKDAAKDMAAEFVCPECDTKNHFAAHRVVSHYECKCAQCHHELSLIPL